MVANRNLAPQAGKYARYELERRWLLEQLPEDADSGSLIVDRYIEGTRLRLRHVEPPHEQFKLTQKEAPAPPDYALTVITTIYLAAEEYAVLAALPARVLRKRNSALPPENTPVSSSNGASSSTGSRTGSAKGT